jgi:hypothetical protein
VPAIGSLFSGISSGSSEHEARIRRKIKKYLIINNSMNAQVSYFNNMVAINIVNLAF